MSEHDHEITELAAGTHLRFVRCGRWEYAERTNATGVVYVLAVTDNERIILVEQHRIPVDSPVIELPAGLVGDDEADAQEGFADAARRELLEETGYVAERIERITEGPSSPGLCSEMVILCRATGLKKVGSGGGVGHEEITVHEIPLAEIDEWLNDRAMVDPKVYAGLYFVERGRRKQQDGSESR